MTNKNIIIAFDGPDNVGKGTQIALLRKWLSHLPFVVTDLEKPCGSSNEEKINYGLAASRNHLKATEAIWKEGIPQIIDRMHYTEYAYSIFRGGHEMQTIISMEKEFIHLKESFLIIVFVDEVENIRDRDDGKSNYNAEDLNEAQMLCDRFEDIAEESLFDNHVINIHNKNIEVVKQEVQSLILEKFQNILEK